MVEAIRYVFRHSKRTVLLSAAASLLSGVCNVYLLAMVSNAINKMTQLPAGYGVRFLALLLITLASTVIAQVLSVHLTAAFATKMRMQLSNAIMESPLRTLEEIGSPKLIAALTQDAGSIAQAALQVPQFGMNIAIILGCLVYLAIVFLPAFVAMLLIIPVSVAIYLVVEYFAVRFHSLERESWDHLVKHFQMLVSGMKELKLNRARRINFFTEKLARTSRLAQRYGVRGAAIYIAITSWSNLLCFAAIGVIAFVLPRMGMLNRSALVSSALVALFLRIPVAGLIDSLREFNRASVALRKLRKMRLPWDTPQPPNEGPWHLAERWQTIELLDVKHGYHSADEMGSFVLGPVSMTLTPGRMIFITGGNGSGKTTLAKLIVGLYGPESGVVKVNGRAVHEDERDRYRQHFSAIFAEYALFEDVVAEDSTSLHSMTEHYLQLLHLDHKVRLCQGAFSTTDLSSGQRRRLALVHAYLEDRPVYLFDEWAADQDPVFREIFYRDLLPDLRGKGKAVIVISHDDRYFHLADEIMRLENGKIVATTANTGAEPLSIPSSIA